MNPIFIIGNPRSGTTMLRLMLTCHPNICVPPESGWLIGLYSKYNDFAFDKGRIRAFVNDLFLSPMIEVWGLDSLSLLERLEKAKPKDYATLASHVYFHYVEIHQPGKLRWGDKNNFYLNYIEKINRIFPDAVFLHIIRDGRDVACSYRDLSQTKGKYAPKLPASVCGAACDWVKNVKTIQKCLSTIGAERALTIRYEDLVQQPQKTLQTICAFLGEDYDERMLNFDEENQRKQLEPEIFMDWKARTQKPLTDSRVGRWKQEMFEEDKRLFQFLARKTLMSYGYEVESSMSISLPLMALRFYSAIWLLGKYGQRLVRIMKRGIILLVTDRTKLVSKVSKIL